MGRVDLQPHHDGAMHALNADDDERAAPMRRGRSSRLRGYRAVAQVERYRPEAERLRRAEPELYAEIHEQAKKDPEAKAAAARDPDLREAVDQRSEQIERRFEKPIVIAALLVIPIMVLEHTAAGEPWSTLATVANWLIWGLFAAEVVVMLAVVPDRRRWLREHLLEIAIVVLTPPFLPASLQALRAFRVFRLLRLIAIVRYARRLFTLNGLRYGALVALVTVLAGGAAFAYAEGRSTWDGVWWAMTTVTTVGYGDISPETGLGRALAILVMLVGIGFLSLLIGSVSERFLRTDLEQEAEVVERVARASTLKMSVAT